MQVKFIMSPGNEHEQKADHGRVEDLKDHYPPRHVLTVTLSVKWITELALEFHRGALDHFRE